MPVLYILAGPNGAGKTSFYDVSLEEGLIDATLPFINVDLITRNEFGSYTVENYAKADEVARLRMNDLIKNSNDLMVESNLASQNDYDWINAIIKKGYEVCLYFFYTRDVQVNIGRVEKRVAEGGHDVATAIIEQRYKMGLTYLKGNFNSLKALT